MRMHTAAAQLRDDEGASVKLASKSENSIATISCALRARSPLAEVRATDTLHNQSAEFDGPADDLAGCAFSALMRQRSARTAAEATSWPRRASLLLAGKNSEFKRLRLYFLEI